MCSQPIVQEAQLSRATARCSCRSSAASADAPSKSAAWKLRVGRVEIVLKARRLANVPSSRYFAVAGPKERSRSSLASATTRAGSATSAGAPAERTATALRRFAPSTAPSPPRPACRPSCETVAKRTSRSPAGPIAATRQPAPCSSRSRPSASLADRPQRSPAGSRRAPCRSTSSVDGSEHSPRTTSASWPVSLPAMAK